MELLTWVVKWGRSLANAGHSFYSSDWSSLPLGKLGFKEEPAGKVRVFAMVDCWTQ